MTYRMFGVPLGPRPQVPTGIPSGGMPFEGNMNMGGPSKYPGVMAGGMPVPTQLPGWPVQQPISGGLGGIGGGFSGQPGGLGQMPGRPPGFGGNVAGLLQALMARTQQRPGAQPVPGSGNWQTGGPTMPAQSPFAGQAPPGFQRRPGLFAGQPFSQQPRAQMPQMNSQRNRGPQY